MLAGALVLGSVAVAGGRSAAVDPPADAVGGNGGEFVVADAPNQFAALKHHGEALAWRNDESAGAIDPSVFDHYQGIARYPGTGLPVFYVSQLDDDDGGVAGGYVHVVEYGTRDRDGERLRSNLQRIGSDTEEVTPDASDTWVRSIRFDGSVTIDGEAFPTYKHPGAAAIVDDVLLLPIDQPTSSSAPTGQIVLLDLAGDRLDPEPIHALPLEHGIDNLAITRRTDDSYLIWTNGDGGEDINVYETSTADLRDDGLGIELVQSWEPSNGGLSSGTWPTGTGAHQSSGFVREPDGSLYLIGMRHPGGVPFGGSDHADLYAVAEPTPGEFVLTLVQSREFHCVYDGGGGPVDMRICNFTAAGGTYVSPSGELILYAMPHDDEDGFDPDIARMAEFRHRDVTRVGSPLLAAQADAGGPYAVTEGGTIELSGSGRAAADRPWVELYDDTGFDDRSIVVDYDDRHLLELNNFNDLDDFNDKPSAVRWRAPVGVDIQLFDDDNFEDRSIILKGTGETEAISDLDDHPVELGVVEHVPARDAGENIGFGDKTSSLRFNGSPPPISPATVDWDLDGDGLFGETGAAALQGDEVGPTPTFDAASIDGPNTVSIALRTIVSGTVVATDTTNVIVANAAPTVDLSPSSTNVDEGDELVLTLDASDAAPADTLDVDIAWGDGDTTNVALGTDRSATVGHVYVDDDPSGTSSDVVSITATVTDDDGGSSSNSADVTVHNVAPVPAIEQLASNLPFTLRNVPVTLEGSFTDAGVTDTHAPASITWGDGATDTTPVDDIAATHTYTTTGEFEVTLTVIDDDLGVGVAMRSLDVVTPAQAAESLLEILDGLIAEEDDENLLDARRWLIGSSDGDASNGALDKIEDDDLPAALRRLEQFVESLREADGVDTSELRQLTATVADSIAHTLFDEVLEAYPDPSPGEERQLERVEELLQEGRIARADMAYLDAIDAFHEAVRRSTDLLE